MLWKSKSKWSQKHYYYQEQLSGEYVGNLRKLILINKHRDSILKNSVEPKVYDYDTSSNSDTYCNIKLSHVPIHLTDYFSLSLCLFLSLSLFFSFSISMSLSSSMLIKLD